MKHRVVQKLVLPVKVSEEAMDLNDLLQYDLEKLQSVKRHNQSIYNLQQNLDFDLYSSESPDQNDPDHKISSHDHDINSSSTPREEKFFPLKDIKNDQLKFVEMVREQC